MFNLLGRKKINTAMPQEEQKEKAGALITKEPITKEEREILEAEKIYRAGTVSVRDLIAPSAMKVQPQFLELGGPPTPVPVLGGNGVLTPSLR
mgnify:CR=1 FL=1